MRITRRKVRIHRTDHHDLGRISEHTAFEFFIKHDTECESAGKLAVVTAFIAFAEPSASSGACTAQSCAGVAGHAVCLHCRCWHEHHQRF